MKHKVYCGYKMPEKFVDMLRQNGCEVKVCQNKYGTQEELLQDTRDFNAIICPASHDIAINKEVLDAAGPLLKTVCTISTGYNHIDLESCRNRNIRVGRVGNMDAEYLTEFTIGLMIASGRKFKAGMNSIIRGAMTDYAYRCSGQSLKGSTVGIVGFGNIGQTLAKQLKAFSVRKILYSGPNQKSEGDVIGAEFTTFEELVQLSDYVVISCPLNDKTKNMFNKEVFDLMKPTSVLINIARGAIIDHEALLDALKKNKIFSVGLDVTVPEPFPKDHPLLEFDNCFILPHMAAMVDSLHDQLFQTSVENVLAALNDLPMPCQLV